MAWEKDPDVLTPSKGYTRVRRVNRALMDTWFREISLVDLDTLPQEGGIVFTAWHPGGLIDPMLMMAALPGGLTFAAKSPLFKTPILGHILRAIDAKPVLRPQDNVGNKEERKKANSGLIDTLSSSVASGQRVAIFPEGISHTKAHPVKMRTGAARILLDSIRKADEMEKPRPHLVPIGLHYSDQHQFRERVSLQVNRSLTYPPLPGEEGALQPSSEELAEHGELAHDRVWCEEMTNLLHTEIQRCNQAQETWEDRELVWRARRMIHTARSGDEVKPITFHEAVLGSRRVRAAWQYLAQNDPERNLEMETKFKKHHSEMEHIGLRSWELRDREKKISKTAFLKNMLLWIWSASWMLGIVTWSAMIGAIVPYMFIRLVIIIQSKNEENHSAIGSMKLLYSVALYPIWWVFTSISVGWLLASKNSFLQDVELPGYILPALAFIPWPIVSLMLLVWWPISARLHLKLFERLCKSWRNLRLWSKLRSGQVEWQDLIGMHHQLAKEMASIGEGLILPGDPDWKEPPYGKEDWEVVHLRTP